ncbi:MAG: AMP-binding protein [Candidatus Hydrogenedens sp.]|jgi:acyl-[acyl-carrier-protein]-phospholipid O-acyltransferase/long-chain-fatty-acid--[acyl-carrier-protein] ligase|nr:AMP-binding protein [Candidatus Hydrogenedens sp.]
MASQSITPAAKRRFRPGGFWALMATQFQGAFNDNLYQWVIVYYLLALATQSTGTSEGSLIFGKFTADTFVPSFATFLFSLPFIIFPALFGAIADRYSKQSVAVSAKVLEIFIMAAGGVAFLLGWTPLIWFLLFMMATQSALFGPAKYGILPEILPADRLSWGNGVIQMGTMLAIILGTGLAGPLFLISKGHVALISVLLVFLSIMGTGFSFKITRPPAANPTQPIPGNPFMPWQGMLKYFRAIRQDRILYYAVVGYTYFWFIGALARQNIIKFSYGVLLISEDRISYLLATVAIGIGLGALAAGYLSRGKVEIGLIPLGAVGTMVFSILLAVPYSVYRTVFGIPLLKAASIVKGGGYCPVVGAIQSVGGYYLVIMVLFLFLGAFAGLYGVPLAAAIQRRAPYGMKGGVIAAVNMLTWVGIALSSIVFLTLDLFGLTASHIFIFMGVTALGIGLLQCWRSPVMAIRLFWWLLDCIWVRLLVQGRGNLPEQGGALLVGTQESFIDTMVIQATTDREIHFVIGKDALEIPRIRRFARYMNLIPVDPHSEEDHQQAVEKIRSLLKEGQLVCVSRWKTLAAEGLELPWFQDYGLLTEATGVPTIPIAFSRICEILYSYKNKKLTLYFPEFRSPVYLHFGEPVKAGASAVEVRTRVQATSAETYRPRVFRDTVLQYGFLRMARRFPWRPCFADHLSGQISYFKALIGVIVLARKLKPLIGPQEKVGVLMPSTVAGALANIALQVLGKIPVNLNYTASSEIIADCASRCDITHTVTANAFLQRVPIIPPGEAVYLDEIRDTVSAADRIIALLMALFLPRPLLLLALGAKRKTENDIATIIFSSGSEGIPKGVMLSHRNVITMMHGMREMVRHDKHTGIVGFLPFFHSFGFAVALWTPLLEGIQGILHPNPLEPKPIGQLIKKYNGTIMIATPTFLQGFIRRCHPDQMASLDYVIAGAEKLPDRIRKAFFEKFGNEPLEGYGTTECAPVVAVNLHAQESPGFYTEHARTGSIGRAFPYQEAKVVDPDTGEELAAGEAGMLLLKGQNVMLGYLNDKERTDAALKDGWYTTGDIAAIDEDGFIFITDRLARFSKIGGEMIPHIRIEESMHQLLGLTEQALVITGVPDDTRGERLIVLHTLEEEDLAQLKQRVNESDLPNLWRPRANDYFHLEEIPVLGTGKIDIQAVKNKALVLTGKKE